MNPAFRDLPMVPEKVYRTYVPPNKLPSHRIRKSQRPLEAANFEKSLTRGESSATFNQLDNSFENT